MNEYDRSLKKNPEFKEKNNIELNVEEYRLEITEKIFKSLKKDPDFKDKKDIELHKAAERMFDEQKRLKNITESQIYYFTKLINKADYIDENTKLYLLEKLEPFKTKLNEDFLQGKLIKEYEEKNFYSDLEEFSKVTKHLLADPYSESKLTSFEIFLEQKKNDVSKEFYLTLGLILLGLALIVSNILLVTFTGGMALPFLVGFLASAAGTGSSHLVGIALIGIALYFAPGLASTLSFTSAKDHAIEYKSERQSYGFFKEMGSAITQHIEEKKVARGIISGDENKPKPEDEPKQEGPKPGN